MSEFYFVVKADAILPRTLPALTQGISDKIHVRPNIMEIESNKSSLGFDFKIVVPGEHDFKDLQLIITEINYWLHPEAILEYSFNSPKA